MPSAISASEYGERSSDAWEKAVRFLLENGEYSPSVRGPTIECVNFTVVVNDPRSEPRLSSKSPHFLADDAFSQQILHHPKVRNWRQNQDDANEVGVDQIDQIINLLRTDPLSRRAVVGIWDPLVDLKIDNPQGVIALIFAIRSRRFHLTSLFRTTDAWMANWTLVAMSDLQTQVFERLTSEEPSIGNVELGSYAQFHASFHMYLDDVPHAKRLLAGKS
jgi:hypothetical protein